MNPTGHQQSKSKIKLLYSDFRVQQFFLNNPKKKASEKFRSLVKLGWKDLNPRNNGVRVRCLTTWRHPSSYLTVVPDDFYIISHHEAFVKCFFEKN